MDPVRVAVLLVAGVGSRLRPLTNDRPKALVDIGGQTILGRAVAILKNHGVERVVLATGYREDAVQKALAGAGVEAVFCRNERYDTTQNSVSLALCAEAVAGQAFYKLDGDVVFRETVLQRLDGSGAPLAVAVDRSRRTDAEAMKVRLDDGTRRIAEFGKGIALESAAGESIGIERIDARISKIVFDAVGRAMRRGREDLYYEDVYSELIDAGSIDAEAVDVGDLPWTEVDDPTDLERARALVGDERNERSRPG